MSKEKVKLFGKDFSLSPEKHNYLEVCNQFKCLADEAYNHYINVFNQNFTNLDDIEEKGAELIREVFYSCSEKILKLLSQYGIFDISIDNIMAGISKQGYVEKSVTTILDKYWDIKDDETIKDNQRKAKSQNRYKWDNDDFWYDGAAKGAVKAGAMNLASGAGHGIANMIEKTASSVAASIKMSKIFEDEKNNPTIANGVWCDVCNSRSYFMDIVESRGKCKYDRISQKDTDEAEVLFDNCSKYVTDIEKKKELLYKILMLNGRERKYYSYGIDTFPDESYSLIIIANWNYVNLKKESENYMDNYLEKALLCNNSDLHKIKDDICQKMNEIGLNECEAFSKINDMIDEEILQKITENYQTADREQCRIILENVKSSDVGEKIKEKYVDKINAQISHFEDEMLQKITENYQTADREQCRIILENVKSADVEKNIKEKYVRKLTARISHIEEELIKKIIVNYENTDVEQCKNMIKNIEQTDVKNTIKNKYIGLLNQRIKSVLTSEDYNAFDKILLETDFTNTESIKRSKEFIENNGKTDVKSEYIKALDGINSNNIKKAQKYYAYKQKGFFKYHRIKLLLLIVAMVVSLFVQKNSSNEIIPLICSLYAWFVIGNVIYVNTVCKNAFNLLTVNNSVINKIITEK